MNLKQAALSAKKFANRLETTAQNIRSVDNNPTFDSDPRDNFVSTQSEGWSYQGQFDSQGKTLDFSANTLEKFEADGVDDIPAKTLSIKTRDNGDKAYQETELVTHPGCIEYFRERSTDAVLSQSGEALVYDTENYGISLAFLS